MYDAINNKPDYHNKNSNYYPVNQVFGYKFCVSFFVIEKNGNVSFSHLEYLKKQIYKYFELQN